jgi:multiple sugar transport system permease protein
MNSSAAGITRASKPHLSKWFRKYVLPYILVALVMIPFIIPMYWMLATSLKTNLDVESIPPKLLFSPTLRGYAKILTTMSYWRSFGNSAIIGISATVIGLLVGLPAAFSIARYRQSRLSTAILFSRMCPHVGLLVPWFVIFSLLGLSDTFFGMVLTHLIITVPLTIWVMIGFFEEVPQEIQDAAFVDGCSMIRMFLSICVPVVLPGIVVSVILGFAFSWNNFLLSAIIGGRRTQTLPVITYLMIGEYTTDWTTVAASGIFLTVPVILLTLVVQRYLIRGLAFGGSKG